MAGHPRGEIERAKATVRALDPLPRAIVEVLALAYDPVPRTDLARVLGKVGHRRDGRGITGAQIAPSLEALTAAGVVEDGPSFRVKGDLVHAATLCALDEGVFPGMVEAVREVRPVPADKATLRDLRLALYTGRWDEARPLVQAMGPSAVAWICRPFDGAWVAAWPADLRAMAARGILIASSVTLDPAPEALALLEAAPELDDKAHRVLVEQMVMRGRFDDADRLLAGRQSMEASVARAQMLFLRGRRAEAIAAFEAALKAFFAYAGKRARFFPDRAGVLFVVALLDEDRPAAVARAKVLADAGHKNAGFGYPEAYAALSEVAAVRAGDEEAEHVLFAGSGLECAKLDAIEVLVRVIAACWIGAPVDPELVAELEQRVHRAEAAGYAWLAGQGADALLRAGGGKGPARLRKLAEAVPGVRLVGLLARPEAWSGALDALLEVASAKEAKAPAREAPAAHDRRLVWILSEQYGWVMVEPREQVRQKGGFSKGRPVALKRLYHEAAAMEFLRAEDRAACLAITEHVSGGVLPRRQLQPRQRRGAARADRSPRGLHREGGGAGRGGGPARAREAPGRAVAGGAPPHARPRAPQQGGHVARAARRRDHVRGGGPRGGPPRRRARAG